MKKKIVSGVSKYTEKNTDGDIVDYLRVHYTDGTSKENASLKVAAREAAVTTTRRVPPDPCPLRHTTEVSEVQSLTSQALNPTRTPTLIPALPKLAP